MQRVRNVATSARRRAGAACLPIVLCACDGPQSALVTAGREAERVAGLWWGLAAGAVVIWLFMTGLILVALHRHAERAQREPGLIIAGGVVVPTLVLTALLAWGLSLLPEMTRHAPAAAVQLDVSGEEWWWRVRYVTADGRVVETANEIRLPVGETAGVTLTSPDVIHALWIPSLAGKRDMIPGRVNHMVLEPTRTGAYRGVCAEYCGTSHAHMNLDVVVMEADAFARWLEAQSRDARPAADADAARGRDLFIASGCGACHTVRGTVANGQVGPDLTHVGGRATLAAGTLPNTPESLARWIADPAAFKPEARMPAFGMLPGADVRAIARWLSGLE